MAKCKECGKEIELGEQVYQMVLGEFKEGKIGEIAFEEAKECAIHGYIHFRCAMEDNND